MGLGALPQTLSDALRALLQRVTPLLAIPSQSKISGALERFLTQIAHLLNV